jgi:hypothetical protein
MFTRHLTRLLVVLGIAAGAGMPGPALAEAPIRIGASISLTGTYAKPGAYGRDGYLLCQKHVTFGSSAGGAGLANEAAGPFQRPAYSMSLPPSRNG